MTGMTNKARLPFLEPTDPLSGVAAAIQDLAQQCFDAKDPLTWVTSTGWTVQNAMVQPVLGDAFVWLALDVTYTAAATLTAADATAAAPGNLADTTVCTLAPASYRPAVDFLDLRFVNNSVATWFGRWNTSGAVLITHGPTSGKIPQNTQLSVRQMVPRFDVYGA